MRELNIALVPVILVILVIPLIPPFHTIHEGHVGIYWRFGALSNRVTEPGASMALHCTPYHAEHFRFSQF